MSSSLSNASESSVTDTEPSIMFSIGTTPNANSPRSTAAITSGTERCATRSCVARSCCERSASSVNVPGGPKYVIRATMDAGYSPQGEHRCWWDTVAPHQNARTSAQSPWQEAAMRAAMFVETGKPLVIEEVEPSAPGPRDVVVELGASGVCHSDLSLKNGYVGILPGTILG